VPCRDEGRTGAQRRNVTFGGDAPTVAVDRYGGTQVGDDTLREYLAKRDLERTPEPGGQDAHPADAGESEGTRFVIQEHDASSHHFDLRLEAEGVLKSWAVPKGPSTDPDDQRLAVRTEDHPLSYADFEGTIPDEEYGGGSVIVWDAGTYRNLTTDDEGTPVPVAEAIDAGSVRFWLHGEKVGGRYQLVHARIGGDDDNWLLRKLDDDEADARRVPTTTEPRSVLSGRTNEEVTEGEQSGEETGEGSGEGSGGDG
jgi:DNA ligase D-like protein (predicted 3'-phosphoesterase)